MVPTQSYIIAATPRTGSNLLCEGLEATKVAGRPLEAFTPDFRNMLCHRWLLSPNVDFRGYLRAALQHGTSANGVHGLKIHWMHIPPLARNANFAGESADVLLSLFPRARFVNIVRRDRRGQALSWFRAIQTGEWCRIQSECDEGKRIVDPAFDANVIQALEAEIAQQQSAWEQYFQERNIDPLLIEYEVLAEDYMGQVARVLAFLGLDVAAARLIPSPRLVRQSDALTLRWRRCMEAVYPSKICGNEVPSMHYCH
jgi:LPS sulfotransferase NodH